MHESDYEHVLHLARQLAFDDRLKLARVLLADIEKNVPTSRQKQSVLEIEGLGAELWRAVKIERYLETERDSWSDKA